MDPDAGLALLLFVLFLIAGGFVVLCQNSIIELSDSKFKHADGTDPRALKLARLMRSPSRFSSAMRGAYTFCHLCAVAFLARFFGVLFRDAVPAPLPFWTSQWGQLLGSLGVVVLGVFFILTFSRGLPRKLAALASDSLALALAGPAAAITALFTPMSWVVEKVVGLLFRICGIQDPDQQENVTEEEIRMLVDVSEETGGIEPGEKDMINNVFDFADRTVDEIMTHRTDVTYLEEDATTEEIVELCTCRGFSRIPVVGEDGLDDIVGILNVKDLLPLILTQQREAFCVSDFLRQPVFVPESTKCRDLFGKLNQQKIQIAVVVDEYGGTSGIVTMEDLLESIVGDIQDEYDSENHDATELSRDSYTFDGDIDIGEVERLMDCDLSEAPDCEDYDTLGGLLIGLLDRIPALGEHPSVELGGIRLTVQDSNERQILRVLAERIVPLPQEPEKEN